MTRLRVAPEAEEEEELAAAAEWYEARRPGLGVELVASIDGAFEEILAAPLSHAAGARTVRIGRRSSAGFRT